VPYLAFRPQNGFTPFDSVWEHYLPEYPQELVRSTIRPFSSAITLTMRVLGVNVENAANQLGSDQVVPDCIPDKFRIALNTKHLL
jgi:hypothetical protein